MPKEIWLTRGQVAIVDDEYYDSLVVFPWYAAVGKQTFYGARRLRVAEHPARPLAMLHRVIMRVVDPDKIVDHKDGNGLNCQKRNLRIVEKDGCRGNNANRRKRAGMTSKYKGVSWHAVNGKWRANIQFGTVSLGELTYLGSFDSEEAAARAYDVAACDIFGSSANLNFGEYV